jgi:lipopolysaccharide heptosyltransferase II
MTFFKAVCRWGFLLFAKIGALLLLSRWTSSNYSERIQKILVYADMGIGNMILFTPTLQAIRNQFPKAKITLLVGKSGCDQVVECSSLVDEVLKMKYSLFEVLWLSSVVREKNFDLLISTFLSGSKYLTLLTIFSRIPIRAGHCQSDDWPSPLDFLYNIEVKMIPGTHEVERHLCLAEHLHCKKTDYPINLKVYPEDHKFAEIFFAEHFPLGARVLGISSGTSLAQNWKQWDIKKIAEVCDRSIDEFGFGVLLFGSSDLLPEQDLLSKHMKNDFVSCVGKTTIRQAVALIAKCDLMLASDTGLMHIGDAMGTPTLGIFGPTDHNRTGPWGKGNTIIRKEVSCSPCYTISDMSASAAIECPHHDCLNSISSADVILEVEKYIKK